MKLSVLKEIRFKEFIALIASITIFIDVIFFKYILPPVVKKRNHLLSQCKKYDSKIYSTIDSIESKKSIFIKIPKVAREINTYKKQILLLKSKKVSVLDVAHMIKALFLKSGINVIEFNVGSVKKQQYRITYTFNVEISDTLDNIVRFLDTVENYSRNMQIPSYSLKEKDGIFDAKLTIEYVQVNMK